MFLEERRTLCHLVKVSVAMPYKRSFPRRALAAAWEMTKRATVFLVLYSVSVRVSCYFHGGGGFIFSLSGRLDEQKERSEQRRAKEVVTLGIRMHSYIANFSTGKNWAFRFPLSPKFKMAAQILPVNSLRLRNPCKNSKRDHAFPPEKFPTGKEDFLFKAFHLFLGVFQRTSRKVFASW